MKSKFLMLLIFSIVFFFGYSFREMSYFLQDVYEEVRFSQMIVAKHENFLDQIYKADTKDEYKTLHDPLTYFYLTRSVNLVDYAILNLDNTNVVSYVKSGDYVNCHLTSYLSNLSNRNFGTTCESYTGETEIETKIRHNQVISDWQDWYENEYLPAFSSSDLTTNQK